MSTAPEIISIDPRIAIPGGEVVISCDLGTVAATDALCLFDGIEGDITAASRTRLLVRVPDGLGSTEVEVAISNGDQPGNSIILKVAECIASDLHNVANPAVDPHDDSVIVTRSGTRGQTLENTLVRLTESGLINLDAKVMNPTGVAFDPRGRLFVTNRADGEVVQIVGDTEAVSIATGLGVATGIAFSEDGTMYIGDRNGPIYRVSTLGDAREWSELEPSVSAFHMAFGDDGNLYVSGPGLCSYDVIHKIGPGGEQEVFFKGLGRPQGIAFDNEGNLYVAACLSGRHGIVRISPSGEEASHWVAGMSVVGLCFDRGGRLLIATSDSVYALQAGVFGTILK